MFKPGNRTVHLLGQTHDTAGGYLECQQCGKTANNKNAFSSLWLQGNCLDTKGKHDAHEQNNTEGEHVQRGATRENIEGDSNQRQQGNKNQKNASGYQKNGQERQTITHPGAI